MKSKCRVQNAKCRLATLLTAGVLAVAGGCTANPADGESPLKGILFINEFLASNNSGLADEHGDYDDWIELYNAGETAIDLHGICLTDDLLVPNKWWLPDTTIPAHGYLLVWADNEEGEGPLHAGFRLNAGSGEHLGLYYTDALRTLVVDTLSYGPQQADISYGRLPDGGSDWHLLPVPTPGTANVTGASPLTGVLFINEFLASNGSVLADEEGDYDDWIELYNAGETAIGLSGMYLTDNLSAPAKWAFPDTSISAHGFLLVWADNEESEGPLHAGFNLSAGSGEQLGLFDIDSLGSFAIDTTSFGPQRTDTSHGRYPDGQDDWQSFPTPTPGAPNQAEDRTDSVGETE